MTSRDFKLARIRMGLTQAELGQKIGMEQPRISAIERGHRRPTKQQEKFMMLLLSQWVDEP